MRFVAIAAVAALALPSAALADRPPEGAISITEAISIAEGEGLVDIHDVEFDDGRWEVDGYENDREIEIKIDGMTGEVVGRD